jgi:hypothetical protein
MKIRSFVCFAVLGLSAITACSIAASQSPIVNPILIDQKEAKDRFIAAYSDAVVKADKGGLFDVVTTICRKFKTGELTLAGVKSSQNNRYHVYMFKEKGKTGPSPAEDYPIIAFHFNPGSELTRVCKQDGPCDVYVRNGFARVGRTSAALGEPAVADTGITVKFVDDRSYAFDYLFSYDARNRQEGNALISLFLSAFPVLGYE